MRVAIAFHKLLERLQPTKAGILKAKLHTTSIKARLTSSFELNKVIYMGSTARLTAIKGYSDVDLLTVLPRKVLKWGTGQISSDTFINNIRDDLNERFHATTVRRDKQAVVVMFGGGTEPIDVVPAIFHEFKTSKKVPVYLIPDGNGGWLETAPDAHNNYIKAANIASRGKLNKTIQLLKHWRNTRQPIIPLTSIHLELLLASSRICSGPKSYARCVHEALILLESRGARGLHDPTQLAGILSAANTDAQKKSLSKSLSYAVEHADKAVDAQERNDWKESLRQWSIVFNNDF